MGLGLRIWHLEDSLWSRQTNSWGKILDRVFTNAITSLTLSRRLTLSQCLALIVVTLLWSVMPSIIIAAEKDYGWSYSVKHNIERTKRTYLLVANSMQRGKARQITVISKCRKDMSSEGVYGTCTHNIHIHSTKKKFTIKTGEDVVLINPVWDTPLILGTIGYGCCGAPNGVSFYTEHGKYLGSIRTYDISQYVSNTITGIYYFENSVYDEQEGCIAVEDDSKENYYYAWVKNGRNKFTKVPILYSISNKKDCAFWVLTAFTNYGDRHGITMKLSGKRCSLKDDLNREVVSLDDREVSFDCYREEGIFNCYPYKENTGRNANKPSN